MSLIDESSKFTFSGHNPVASPCGKYIAYLNSSKLVIRESESLNLLRLVRLNSKTHNKFIRISQIKWEPEHDGESSKIGVLIANENTIKIYDIKNEKVDISIIEDNVFGIEIFEWLPKGQESIDTAYERSKQLVVFSTNEICAKIFSLDYPQPLLTIENPKFNKVLFKPNSNIFTIITSHNNKYKALNFMNNGSTISNLHSIDLGSLLNLTDSVEWSPNGQWLLCNDSIIGETKISTFPLFTTSISNHDVWFNFQSDKDPLGAVDVRWIDDDRVYFSDHYENIHQLKLSTGLVPDYTLFHRSKLKSAKIWKQDYVEAKYFRRQQSYKVPQIENLPLHMKGVLKFLVNGDNLFVTTRSMPSAVFIWDLTSDDDEPAEVLVTNNRIRDIIVSSANKSLLLVVNEDSISLWHKGWTAPLCFPLTERDDSLVKGAAFMNVTKGSAKILIWTSDSFYLAKFKLSVTSEFEGMDTEQISIIRNGSPGLVDDLSHVVELANAVQQREWVHNETNTISMEDTFLNKKPIRLIPK